MISRFPSSLSKQIAFFLGNTEIFTYGRKEELREGGRGVGGGEVGRLKKKRGERASLYEFNRLFFRRHGLQREAPHKQKQVSGFL